MNETGNLVERCRRERNALLAATLLRRLENRGFDAYYCATKEEALQQALALIPKEPGAGP